MCKIKWYIDTLFYSNINFDVTISRKEIETIQYNRAFNTTLCNARILIDSSARGNPIHQIVDSWCEFHSSALTSSVLCAGIHFHFGTFVQWSIEHKNGSTQKQSRFIIANERSMQILMQSCRNIVLLTFVITLINSIFMLLWEYGKIFILYNIV